MSSVRDYTEQVNKGYCEVATRVVVVVLGRANEHRRTAYLLLYRCRTAACGRHPDAADGFWRARAHDSGRACCATWHPCAGGADDVGVIGRTPRIAHGSQQRGSPAMLNSWLAAGRWKASAGEMGGAVAAAQRGRGTRTKKRTGGLACQSAQEVRKHRSRGLRKAGQRKRRPPIPTSAAGNVIRPWRLARLPKSIIARQSAPRYGARRRG